MKNSNVFDDFIERQLHVKFFKTYELFKKNPENTINGTSSGAERANAIFAFGDIT